MVCPRPCPRPERQNVGRSVPPALAVCLSFPIGYCAQRRTRSHSHTASIPRCCCHLWPPLLWWADSYARCVQSCRRPRTLRRRPDPLLAVEYVARAVPALRAPPRCRSAGVVSEAGTASSLRPRPPHYSPRGVRTLGVSHAAHAGFGQCVTPGPCRAASCGLEGWRPSHLLLACSGRRPPARPSRG